MPSQYNATPHFMSFQKHFKNLILVSRLPLISHRLQDFYVCKVYPLVGEQIILGILIFKRQQWKDMTQYFIYIQENIQI